MKKNRELIVNSIVRDFGLVRADNPPLFNQFIIQITIESKAMAVSDASAKDREMGRIWIFKNQKGDCLLSNKTYYKKWKENLNVLVEAITLLELAQVIEWKSRYISNGKIIIALDCREVYHKVVKEIIKINHIIWNGGRELAVIK